MGFSFLRGWTVVACAAAATSCGAVDGGNPNSDEAWVDATRMPLAVDAPLDPTDAVIPWRWIGMKRDSDQPCPVPRGTVWKAKHLFAPGSPDVTPNSLPPVLRGFCAYSAKSGATFPPGRPPELDDLTRRSNLNRTYLTRIEYDHQAVSPFGTTIHTASLSDRFHAQLARHSGRFVEIPLNAGASPPDPGQVPRLALLDTVPTFEPGMDPASQQSQSPHGHGLTNIAQDSLCDPTGRCMARISTQLAMPFVRTGRGTSLDEVLGGFYGSIGWFAQAVRREVRAWEREKDADAAMNETNLILNLSLGWSPDYGGDTGSVSSWPLDVQAAFWAVADAHCRGALIIAAAGNGTGGPTGNHGPVLPAAWERYNAPSQAMCNRLLGDERAPRRTSRSSYRPLLYAASGIDYKGDDLGVSREGGRSRLAAFGDHAITPDAHGKMTQALTGTSVSTTVVAAAAAAAWYYQPELTLFDIMALVRRGAEDIGRAPDFCASSAGADCGGNTRRPTVCGAARAACTSGTPGALCPASFPACRPWGKDAIDTSGITFERFDSRASKHEVNYTTTHTSDAACGAGASNLATDRDTGAPSQCPEEQFYGHGARPWTLPQPESDPCPNCFAFLGTDELRMSNPGDFSTYTASTIAVTDIHGTTTEFAVDGMHGTDVIVQFEPGVLEDASTVTYTGVADGSSHTSAMYVGW